MPALEPFYYLIDNSPKGRMSKNEMLLTEVILFLQLEYALNKIINTVCINERCTDGINHKENVMIENNFVKNLIEDILSTEEYTLPGMAYHLNVPEEILVDILTGYNQSPSLSLARKIMELHKFVRRDLYEYLVKKIILRVSEIHTNEAYDHASGGT